MDVCSCSSTIWPALPCAFRCWGVQTPCFFFSPLERIHSVYKRSQSRSFIKAYNLVGYTHIRKSRMLRRLIFCPSPSLPPSLSPSFPLFLSLSLTLVLLGDQEAVEERDAAESSGQKRSDGMRQRELTLGKELRAERACTATLRAASEKGAA